MNWNVGLGMNADSIIRENDTSQSHKMLMLKEIMGCGLGENEVNPDIYIQIKLYDGKVKSRAFTSLASSTSHPYTSFKF